MCTNVQENVFAIMYQKLRGIAFYGQIVVSLYLVQRKRVMPNFRGVRKNEEGVSPLYIRK